MDFSIVNLFIKFDIIVQLCIIIIQKTFDFITNKPPRNSYAQINQNLGNVYHFQIIYFVIIIKVIVA